METKCIMTTVTRDFPKGRSLVTFDMPLMSEETEAALRGGDLRVTAVRWRKKRSLDANAYYWVLLTQVAEALHISKTEAHNQMLSDYGQLDMDSGQVISVMIKDEVDWRKVTSLHLRPTVQVVENSKGTLFRCFYVVRGSHTYDTAEMSHLINGLVSEAKEMGIETASPKELERMLELWGKRKKEEAS